MTIDEAISWYETKLTVNRAVGFLGSQNDAAILAIEALREKAARENPEPSPPRQHWITQILSERDRQDAKWGFPQENTYCEWSSILAEETGELAKELNELNFGRGSVDRMAEEAVQVAAVVLSILEHQEIAHMVTAAWFAYRHKPEQEE